MAVFAALFLVSAKNSGVTPDVGFRPGEQLPSVEVEGVRWFSDLRYDSISYVVVWSKDDALSRAVSAWVSRSAADSAVGTYSVCVDSDQTDAQLFSLLDAVTPDTEVLGLGAKGVNKRDLKAFKKEAVGRLFVVKQGVISDVLDTETVWQMISSGADLLKERAVFGAENSGESPRDVVFAAL